MRKLAVFFLLAAPLGADLSEARNLLGQWDADARSRGLAMLIRQNDLPAVNLLIECLRRGYEDFPQKQADFEKVMRKSTRAIERATAELEEMIEKREFGDRATRKINEMNEMLEVETARVDAAMKRFLPASTIIVVGTAALSQFTAKEAQERIAEVARTGRPGPLRNACIGALQGGGEGVVPDLLAISREDDSRARSFGVRALRGHLASAGVPQRLRECLSDPQWSVRRGAARSLAAAPPPLAVPALLEARLAAEGGEARILDVHLHSLTGLSFSGPKKWRAWWKENEAAVRAGSFVRTDGTALPGPMKVAFNLPLTSRDILVVVDLSKDARGQSARIQAGVGALLEALPEDGRFRLAVLDEGERHFSRRPVSARPSNRAKAMRWLERLTPGGPSYFSRLTGVAKVDYDGSGGQRRFEDLPDTIYLIVTRVFGDDIDAERDTFLHWNRPVGAVLHIAALGPNVPHEALASFAEATGGSYSP